MAHSAHRRIRYGGLLLVVLAALFLVLAGADSASADSGASFGGSSFGAELEEDAAPGDDAAGAPVARDPNNARTSPAPAPTQNLSSGRGPVDGEKKGPLVPLLIFGGFFAAIIAAVAFGRKTGATSGKTPAQRASAPVAAATQPGNYNVDQFTFGIDGSLKAMRQQLEFLATTSNMSSFDERQAVVNGLGLELARNRESVFFADVERWVGLDAESAERQFMARATSARSKFSRETLRADASGVREAPEKERAYSDLLDEDGDFSVNEIFVLTLILATKKGTLSSAAITDQATLQAVTEEIASIPSRSLIAAEIIWSPSAESDTMSVEEMMSKYPRLIGV